MVAPSNLSAKLCVSFDHLLRACLLKGQINRVFHPLQVPKAHVHLKKVVCATSLFADYHVKHSEEMAGPDEMPTNRRIVGTQVFASVLSATGNSAPSIPRTGRQVAGPEADGEQCSCYPGQ